MLVNIDIIGDILVQAETDFERDYVRQFDGCSYSSFVKCGLTPAEVIGLKLRKTSEQVESPATTGNTGSLQCELHSTGKQCECFVNKRVLCPPVPCSITLAQQAGA